MARPGGEQAGPPPPPLQTWGGNWRWPSSAAGSGHCHHRLTSPPPGWGLPPPTQHICQTPVAPTKPTLLIQRRDEQDGALSVMTENQALVWAMLETTPRTGPAGATTVTQASSIAEASPHQAGTCSHLEATALLPPTPSPQLTALQPHTGDSGSPRCPPTWPP